MFRPYKYIDRHIILRGRQVYLRLPQRGDYADWARLRGDSREFLKPWEPRWISDELSRANYKFRLKRYHKDMRTDQGYGFFIFRKEDHRLAGGLSISNIRRGVSQSCSLGYWTGQTYANQGIMSDAVETIKPFVFNSLRLNRLEAACLPHNQPSQKLLLKTGFQEEGLARQFLRINDQWHDHLLFALLKDDTGL